MSELVYEDELPEMTDEEYSDWHDNSVVVYGVRMGENPITTSCWKDAREEVKRWCDG